MPESIRSANSAANVAEDCLCGSGMSYRQCCEPYHLGTALPDTAEALMRSRFTAYARHDAEYLSTTWDASKRPERIDFAKEQAEWRKLDIIARKKGGKSDQKGLVEFKAYYVLDGDEYAMHELSRFKKTNGRWYYLDGVVKSIGKVGLDTRQGRNAPCPCGSGKKYKRCCGQ
ncbi:MAG: YchJ family protein [Gammaproteobacteria bacterium]